jgi:gamma-glutamyltranspeptidase/glutathione hydrolase
VRFSTIATLIMSLTFSAGAQDRWHARSMTVTTTGIVAASQTLAAQAGAHILERGGSAADAAIAANAALAVTEPMMNGIGGDLFAIVRDAKSGALAGLNASGPAPAAMTLAKMRSLGNPAMPSRGIHSVSVPGCVAGWRALHAKFGKLPWADLFQPAIQLAEQGFPVTEFIADYWRNSDSILRADRDSAVYLPGGAAPRLGEIFRNPELAKALREIASQGSDAFYKGSIAKAIVAKSTQLGGTLAAKDLSSFEPEWVAPIKTTYRGWNVFELPPNGQGIAALEMLNIMEQFDLPSSGPWSADTLHVEIEAQKLAYADLLRYVADPRRAKVPITGLLEKSYAAERAKLIDPKRARTEHAPGMPGQGDTIYLCAVDSDGNLVSLIQSVFLSFGSGVAVPGYGFHLQNRAALFSLDEKHPNALEPGKRPFHTIIPAYMEKGTQHIAFGIMGGFNQAQAHAQFVSRIADHGFNIQQALEAPRFTRARLEGASVEIENRVPAADLADLERRGHALVVRGAYSSEMGGGQAILFDSASKVKYGASSPRKDGAAMPQSPFKP